MIAVSIIALVVICVIAISLAHDGLIEELDKKANKIFGSKENKLDRSERDKFFDDVFVSTPHGNYTLIKEQQEYREMRKDKIWEKHLKDKELKKDVSASLFVECNELIEHKLRQLHDDLLIGAGEYETESYHIRISPIERNLFMVSYNGQDIGKLWIKSDMEGVKINIVRL
jgi:hypothetical protein